MSCSSYQNDAKFFLVDADVPTALTLQLYFSFIFYSAHFFSSRISRHAKPFKRIENLCL